MIQIAAESLRARSCPCRYARAGRRATQAASSNRSRGPRRRDRVQRSDRYRRSAVSRPSALRISQPAAKRCAVSMQTPEPQILAASSNRLQFLEVASRANFPAPPCFRAGFAGRPASTRAPPASALPRSRRRQSQPLPLGRLPGCTTRKSAPSAIRAHDLLMKCLHRPRAQHRIRRREIDQIIAVDHQRPERQVPCAAARKRAASASAIRELSPRSHIRGLDEKICSAFAPSPCAIRARRSCRRQSKYGFRCECCHLSRLGFPVGRRFRTILVGGVKS